jgi:DNA repair exonuclease SbcCD nuclease subunit
MFYLIINLLKSNYTIVNNFGIFGQHDLRYWTNHWESALAVLEAAGAIKLLRSEMGPWHLPSRTSDPTEIYLHGCGWNEEIPKPKKVGEENVRNVLIIHRLFSMKALYPGDENWIDAEGFLKHTKWDLIVAGDNHEHFVVSHNGRHFVNCGSLMRSRIDQINHRPVVYEYHPRTRQCTLIEIPHEPIEQTMDIERIEDDKVRREELEVFVEKVREKTEIEGLDFENNMERRLEEDDITEEMKEIWKEVVQDASARLE